MSILLSEGGVSPLRVQVSLTPVRRSIFLSVPVGRSFEGWLEIGTLNPAGLIAAMACSLPFPSVHPAALSFSITSRGFT